MELRARRVVSSKAFERTIIAFIVLAGLLIGIETFDATARSWRWALEALNLLVLFVFTLEITIRMVAARDDLRGFFRDPWNLFDLSLVVGAIIPLTAGLAGYAAKSAR